MKRYWVIGGNYADTRFDRMQDGGSEQKYGPFKTYEEAKAEWQRRAWSSVDNACARYRIEEDAGAALRQDGRRPGRETMLHYCALPTSIRRPVAASKT